MAVTVVGPVTTHDNSPGSTITIDLPEYVAGEAWLVFFYAIANAVPSDPAGWTRIDYTRGGTAGSGPGLFVIARIPDGTEGPTLTISLGNNSAGGAFAYRIQGAHVSGGAAGMLSGTHWSESSGGNATLLTNAGVTTLHDEALIFHGVSQGSGATDATTITLDSRAEPTKAFHWFDRTSSTNETVGAVGYFVNPVTVSDELLVSPDLIVGQGAAGPTGQMDATSTTAARWTSIALAIRPAGDAPPAGTASGTWVFVGTAAGEAPELPVPEGAATGTWTFTGSAAGAAPVVPAAEGTASGSWSFEGSAAGSADKAGSATATWSYVGTATGTSGRSGAAAGTWAYAGSAVGSASRTGTATGAWAFTGAARGIDPDRIKPPPAHRTHTVPAEDRTHAIDTDQRTLTVEADPRALTVEREDRAVVVRENRTHAVAAENRTVTA